MVGVEVEAEVEVGLDLGPAEDLSAICPRGRDPDGCLASEEEQDGGVTLMFVLAFHGFRGGGGPTRVATDTPATVPPTQPTRSTPTRDTGKQTKRRSKVCGGLEVGDVGGT